MSRSQLVLRDDTDGTVVVDDVDVSASAVLCLEGVTGHGYDLSQQRCCTPDVVLPLLRREVDEVPEHKLLLAYDAALFLQVDSAFPRLPRRIYTLCRSPPADLMRRLQLTSCTAPPPHFCHDDALTNPDLVEMRYVPLAVKRSSQLHGRAEDDGIVGAIEGLFARLKSNDPEWKSSAEELAKHAMKICADLPDFLVTALSAEVTTLADTQRRFLAVQEWMGMSRAAPSDLGLHARLQANEAEAKAAWQRLIDARLANASAEDAAGEDATAGGAGGAKRRKSGKEPLRN